MLAGNYGIGCPLIKRSRDLDPRPGTTFTLAECYRRAGKVASAVELYDEFLALYDTMPNDEQGKQAARWKISKQERANLLNRVPWLTVALPLGAPRDVVILLDDEPFSLDLLEVAFAIDPGTHEFRTRAPGGRWTRTMVQLQEGQRLRTTLNLSHPAQPGSVPPDVPDDPAGQRKVSPWFWVVGSVGLAGLATGAVTGGILLDRANTVKRECPDEKPDGTFECSQAGLDAKQSADTLAPITTASLSVGAGGVVIATIIWLTTHDRRPSGQSGPSGIQPMLHLGRQSSTAGIIGHF